MNRPTRHQISTGRPPTYAILIVALAAGAVAAAERDYEQIIFPEAGVVVTVTTGINARGDIVGQYQAYGAMHGFRLDKHGNYSAIDYPGAVSTNAWSINSPGGVAGDFRLTPNGPINGFVLKNEVWTTIDCGPTLGAVHTFAFGVNASGDVTGEYKLPGVSLGQPGRAFLHADGECTDITPPDAGPGSSVAVAWAISDAGDTAGYFVAGGITHGWVRDRDGNYAVIDYPGSAFTNVRGVNASGDTVGLYRMVANGPTQGFRMSADGSFEPIDYPGSPHTRALGVNARGDAVGDYRFADCPIRRCAWVWR
ncbi:MAG: hypothetical protein OEV41_05120 [Gammaproteobacteria bacterium]|nr:hypothetical protein [Gammaproteobacteria bacterium]MDH5344669.1 hypothetical protein [Gammaproteobacteria bacterium]